VNTRINRITSFVHLGLTDYQHAWDYQASLFQQILQIKSENRLKPAAQQEPTPNHLIFCEHPHVFTLGKSGNRKNLLVRADQLGAIEATFVSTNRGGDITYHGPGQLVGYPVLDLENFFTDIHRYMRTLEEAVIQTLHEVGVPSGRIPGLTGVWIEPENDKHARKICALGVKTSRWVTQHGFAFNVNTNLKYFEYIVPCGISDKAVTSLQQETGKPHDMRTIEALMKNKLQHLFGFNWV
jgi:lipoyl(octanoyl) transferase